MWRLAGLLLVIAIAACTFGWLVTGQSRYRQWAMRLARWGLAAVLIFFGLLIMQHLISGT